MKKFAISLLALASLAGAAVAGSYDNESYIRRDKTVHVSNAGTSVNAFAVENDGVPLTALQRALKNAETNEHDR